MPRDYGSGKKTGIRLYGFDEYIEKLDQLCGSGVDASAEKCFDQCSQIVHEEIEKKMNASHVPESLKVKVKQFKVHTGNVYMYSEGWAAGDKDTLYKVCYLNYGTPKRYTQTGAYRGKIEARGFISNAKRAAANRMKKVQKESLEEMTRGLKK